VIPHRVDDTHIAAISSVMPPLATGE